MSRHFLWGFLYWAKTGKRGYGYIMDRRDYHHALDKYRMEQKLKTERKEMENS